MKKFLILLLMMAYMPFQYVAKAQCTIKSTIVKINSSTPVDDTHCKVNFDFIFTLDRNSGNKYIYIHAWLQNQYPNNFCRTSNPLTKAPRAADLINSVVNIGIHNEPHPQHHLPYFLDSYLPDPSVPLTNPNALNRYVYPAGDSARFTISNIEAIVPLACTSVISLNVDLWSSQADNGTVLHCFTCNTGITIDPRVSGLINCTSPRTFNLQITSVATSPVSGTYKVYLDNMTTSGALGTFGPEDFLIITNPYTTTIAGGINGYFANNVTYQPYDNTKPDANKNLWVLVETAGYTNLALGLLANNCAPLPIQLKSFELRKMNNAVILIWETLTELNSKGFDVQRKQGSAGFESIGFVTAKAMEGSGMIYKFTDEGLKPGVPAFYRLKMVDKDNGVAYSEIRTVRNGSKQIAVSVYPNPGRGIFNVAIPEGVGMMDISLNDITGKSVQRWNSVNVRNLQLSIMKPGIYLLRINFRETGELIAERIVVQ